MSGKVSKPDEPSGLSETGPEEEDDEDDDDDDEDEQEESRVGQSCQNISEKFANCNQDKACAGPPSVDCTGSSSIVEKWNSAFNNMRKVGPSNKPTGTGKVSSIVSPVEYGFEEGFITPNRYGNISLFC